MRNGNDQVCRHHTDLTFIRSQVVTYAAIGKTHGSISRETQGNFRSSRRFPRRRPRQIVAPLSGRGGSFMSIGTIILIILVIALLGGFSGIGGGPFYGTGYYGGGGLGLIIVILLILLLLGRLYATSAICRHERLPATTIIVIARESGRCSFPGRAS